MPSDDDWFTCPVCGAIVQADALACPDCGSDDETGWSDDAAYDEVDLPNEYDAPPPSRARRFWKSAAIIYIGVLLILMAVVRYWIL